MKLLHSRPIIYFALGLVTGAVLGYLLEFNDKYSSELEAQQMDQLLNLLVHLTIGGIVLGGVTILLSRGIAVVFLDEPKKSTKKPSKKI